MSALPPPSPDHPAELYWKQAWRCHACTALYHTHFGRPELCYKCGAMNFKLAIIRVTVTKRPWYSFRREAVLEEFVKYV